MTGIFNHDQLKELDWNNTLAHWADGKLERLKISKKAAIKLFYGACSANMSKSQTAGHAEFWEKASAVDALWWIDRQL